MANSNMKHKSNIEGAWFCTDPDDDNGEGCIACNVCYTGAPDFFAEDDVACFLFCAFYAHAPRCEH